MTTPVRRVALGLVLGAGVPAIPLAAQAPAPTQSATAFTLTIARTIQNGPPMTLEFRGVAARGTARLEVTGGTDAASFPAGSYLMVSDSSGAARLVDPVHGTVQSIGAGARLGGIVELYTPPGAVSDLAVTLDTLGAGDVSGGLATRHYRITTRFSLTVKSETGQIGVAQSSSVTDLWQVEGPVRIPNPFIGLGGDASQDDILAPLNHVLAEMGRQLPGLTLRSGTHSSLSARGITVTQQNVTTQLSGLHPTEVDPARLRIPPGFSTTRD